MQCKWYIKYNNWFKQRYKGIASRLNYGYTEVKERSAPTLDKNKGYKELYGKRLVIQGRSNSGAI